MDNLKTDRLCGLVCVQNEISYIIECLARDYTGEARNSFSDVDKALGKSCLPEGCIAAISKNMELAQEALSHGGGRNAPECARLLETARRRIANEIAIELGMEVPYSQEYYPSLSA